jgi:pimeloyl-ACP methyl ester carboxylesterase
LLANSPDVILTKERTMPTQTKPSIVFVHGIWPDGSCFSKVIPTLQAEGYEVMSSQHSLDTLKDDVATVIQTLGRVGAPAILVGHSYGGTLITAAGTDDRDDTPNQPGEPNSCLAKVNTLPLVA